MITENIYSKWICGNLLIDKNSNVYLKNSKPAKLIYSGGSIGYYVDRRFRTMKWIRENCTKEIKIIKTEIICPF